ncbi:unnamed protein product [Spirodela intermedia]|uniref:Anamorsin homolog n=1 Tax=Spirodela intermedia TaxID=51605 RepID=A0A7I8J8T9_SPIIN|nr:unnamed protein product [Spirodela intermedia]CAA6666626.1 unnamed protein product [Spirodela intermedia]
MKQSALLLTDSDFVPVGAALSAIRGFQDLGEDDLLVITRALQLTGQLPFEPASLSVIVFASKSLELPGEQWFEDVIRVLKPGERSSYRLFSSSRSWRQDIYAFLQPSSALERKLLFAGFLEVHLIDMKSVLQPEDTTLLLTMKAKKASWVVGSSFSLKKRVLPKIQIEDELDLIDEDSLLTEEDLKKPELPPVGDCEVGSTRKACKNCTCGRAEEEQKVQKLALTSELLDNPKSACGSCGLGDAFRCGTCPYRGLPPFQLGKREVLLSQYLKKKCRLPSVQVSLSGSFLAADI